MSKGGPISDRVELLAAWIRRQAAQASASGLVVGLSGGIDSAVVLRLCQLAMPGAVLGALLPCHSDPRDGSDARLVAETFGAPFVTIPLEPAFDALAGTLEAALGSAAGLPQPASAEDRQRAARGNLKPRLRMASLYFLANALNYLVVGTGNRSELSVGYFTKYGDGGTDLLPIGGLLKSDVRALARELGVPPAIIDKPPSAGLWPGQTDEGELGFGYADLESYLREGPEAVAPALALRIERLIRGSEHKRTTPPIGPAPG